MTNVKNVEGLARLVDFCTGLGGTYNPGHQNLQVKNMNALLTHARQTLLEVSQTKTAYENVTDNREVVFSDMNELCSRIIAALKASGSTTLMVGNAKTMTNKIMGIAARDRPAVSPDNPDEGKPKTRRSRDRNFASIVGHFGKLLQTLISEPRYEPNERALTTETLTAKLEALEQHNATVIAAQVNWRFARGRRDAVLYRNDFNVFSTGMTTKEYIKSVFGAKSAEYKQVRKIEFINPIR